MTNFEYERLHHNLKLLETANLRVDPGQLPGDCSQGGKSTIEILDYLVDQELRSKEVRSLDLRMRKAGFRWRRS